MWPALFRCTVLYLLALSATAAQNATPAQQTPTTPTLRVTVTLVQIDAVVTDGAGHRVAGLGVDDFQILQDGAPQQLKFANYIPEEAPAKPTAGLASPGRPQPLSPSGVERTVALVVDDVALGFENIVRTRDALRKYIQEQMRPDDLVALVRTGGGIAILEQFTNDKRVLLEAVDLLRWRFQGRAGIVPIRPLPGAPPSVTGPQERPQVMDYGYSLSALGTLGTVEQVVRGMRDMPGRKSVVLLSDSLRVDPRVNAAIDEVVDLANRSAVSLYTIDPTGLKASVQRRNQNTEISQRSEPDGRFPTIDLEEGDTFDDQNGLSSLASRTGGLFYHNRNDIANSVREAADDQMGYYLLGYSPAGDTFAKDPGKAKFHRLVVKVRPGLHVRWKSGFNGVPDDPAGPAITRAKTREQQLIDALASPFTASGLRVHLTCLYVQSKQNGPVVRSMITFGANGLKFSRDADGAWHASVDIVTSAYRGLKQTMLQRQLVQQIRLPDEVYQKALKDGFLYRIDDRIKEPGAFLVRVVVRDTASQQIGSASEYVQVPDTRKGQLALSSVFLELAPAELMKDAGMEYREALSADGHPEAWTEGGPAMRRYRPGQGILYSYLIINPQRKGSGHDTKVTAQVHLYRDGKLVMEGQNATVTRKNPMDETGLLGLGVLRLGDRMVPGEYLLQVTATDQFGKKNRPVTQWMDFEVVSGPVSPVPISGR